MKRVYYMDNGRKQRLMYGGKLSFDEKTARHIVRMMLRRGKFCFIEEDE